MVVLVSGSHFKGVEGQCTCVHTAYPWHHPWQDEKHLLICKHKGSGWDCPKPVGNISGFNCATEV